MDQNAEAMEKFARLRANLLGHEKLAIAFSGGVDSAFLLKAAADALGAGNVLAVTARAANFPARENDEADRFAKSLGVRHEHLDVDILAVPGFAENGPERCYHCKKSLFQAIMETAGEHGMPVLADGANTDDDDDYRPGARAVRELGVVSPLREAGLDKASIRFLSKGLGIASWNKPSFACLASRVPYGLEITRDILERVEKAERFLFDLGFANVRVRAHGDLARIEVDPAERRRFFDPLLMDKVDGALRAAGFAYTALDLRGYRSGSMNETLPRMP